MAFLLQVSSLPVRAVICNATQSSINKFLFIYKDCPFSSFSLFLLIGATLASSCYIQFSLFKTARKCTGVAEHHLLADVVKCSWFEMGECGMEGLIGRFPAVSVWVYWCCFMIGQIGRCSHLEFMGYHKGNWCSRFTLSLTHQNVIHTCTQYVVHEINRGKKSLSILFLFESSLNHCILTAGDAVARSFYLKHQRNLLETHCCHL